MALWFSRFVTILHQNYFSQLYHFWVELDAHKLQCCILQAFDGPEFDTAKKLKKDCHFEEIFQI